jgi:general secretion pathway protein A
MFESYFGFSENPFKLDPDTSYLFFSQHHQEVIAHLRYAVIEGEGFIAITGEHGVGKTIICRGFIENLGANIIAAYIDTHVSKSEELLKNINAHFEIRHETQDVKELTDALNAFLMQKKVEGKKVAVFIDNAHLLNKDTLEQVRLISNLETAQSKLIQIVMIGQPMLTEMLASYNLRQIGQRVSVKYNIDRLNFTETSSYIQHRVSIASEGPPVLFDQKAIRYIFRYSDGLPRAINIACNQALMEAFNRKATRITGDIADEAVRYLKSRGEKALFDHHKRRKIGWLVAGCSTMLAIAGVAYLLKSGTAAKSKEQFNLQKAKIVRKSITKTPKEPIKTFSADIGIEELHIGEHAFEKNGQISIKESSAETVNETISAGKPSSFLEMTHSIQVGAFINPDNAKRLVEKLKAKGYPVQVFSAKDSVDRFWYTVRIGDYPSEEAAKNKADAFSALEKIETAVRPFGQL